MIDAEAWPRRDPLQLVRILEATPEELTRYRVRAGVEASSLTEEERTRVSEVRRRVLYKGIHGMSLLRIYERAATDGADKFSDRFAEQVTGFVPNATLMSSRTLAAVRDAAARNAQTAPEGSILIPAEIAAQARAEPPRIEPDPTEGEAMLFAGKPARVPLPEPGRAWRGVLIHFQSIAGNGYEPRVLDEFRRRGWAVFDLATESGIRPPLRPESAALVRSLRGRALLLWNEMQADANRRFPIDTAADEATMRRQSERQLRFMQSHPKRREWERLTVRANDLAAGDFRVCGEVEAIAAAAQIAAGIDEALAGNAYAAEAIVHYVKTAREDLHELPIAMIGFSAGALTTPTAAARVKESLCAVVIIGGGANLFMLSQESVFTDGGVRLRCGEGKPARGLVELMSAEYLRASRLDPYWTAPVISDLPLLQVHATRDDWVPAKGGELLWERLGRPDRLTMSGGHEQLFYFLPGRAALIADWVEKHAIERASAAGAQR